MKLSEGLKTVFLAGVGAVAVTGEKSKQLIDDLVKRGELTVEEGKTLNQDLAKKFNERAEGFKPEKLTQSIRDVIYNVEKMTQDERDALRSKLDAADQAAKSWKTPLKMIRQKRSRKMPLKKLSMPPQTGQ